MLTGKNVKRDWRFNYEKKMLVLDSFPIFIPIRFKWKELRAGRDKREIGETSKTFFEVVCLTFSKEMEI